MIDLSTTYLGLKLKNPLVASASPLSKKLDSAKKLEEAGISAIVMYSLFEEQIIHESLELDHYLTRGTDSFAEAMSYLPNNGTYSIGPEKYLSQVTSLKKNLSIPVIGSLNGVSKGGWTRSAKQIQDAGADALELNLYYIPTDTNLTAQELENAQVRVIRAERTFWEKATILHHEAHRPAGNLQPARYSRHYYDLARMAASPVRAAALADFDLLAEVVAFKQRFYPRGWARYELAVPGSLSLVPNGEVLKAVEADYRAMQGMIFGSIPAFQDNLLALTGLESEINRGK